MKAMEKLEKNVGFHPSSVHDEDAFLDAFRLSTNREMLDMFEDDIVVECVDLRKMTKATRLQEQFDALEKVKIKLESENNEMAKRDRNTIKFQRNASSGLIDLNAYNRDPNNPNCYVRPIRKVAPKYAKHFYLDVTLSWEYNGDFDAIVRKFKRAMPSMSEGIYDVKCFMRMKPYEQSRLKKNLVVVFSELDFNNVFFPKETKYIFMGDGGLSYVLIWLSALAFANNRDGGLVTRIQRDNVVQLQNM